MPNPSTSPTWPGTRPSGTREAHQSRPDRHGRTERADPHLRPGEGRSCSTSRGGRTSTSCRAWARLNLGHNHPEVVAAVAWRLANGPWILAGVGPTPGRRGAAEQLVAITPRPGDRLLHQQRGGESIEAALKLAGRRPAAAACCRAWDRCGKTFRGPLGHGNRAYQGPFGPLVPGLPRRSLWRREGLELALGPALAPRSWSSRSRGRGMVTPPPGYLAEAQRLCREAGTLFIADEVQNRPGEDRGRSSPLKRDGIKPDILTLAKSLGGGTMPLGGQRSPAATSG